MADEYINKKDLASIIQQVKVTNEVTLKKDDSKSDKVTIENPKEITKDLVAANKKDSLKKLEDSIEQKLLFRDIADGIKGVGKSIADGFDKLGKSLLDKTGLGKLLGLLGIGAGIILAPFVIIANFFKSLYYEVKFLKFLMGGGTGKAGPLSKMFTRIKDFFKFKWLTDRFPKLKNGIIKLFTKGGELIKGIKGFFSGKGGILSKIFNNTFNLIKNAFTGGKFGFSGIMRFAGIIGRVLGKIFLPITVLKGVYDAVTGFWEGYKEGDILNGIGKAISKVIDGLFGWIPRLMGWLSEKLLRLLGFDALADSIGPKVDALINVFLGSIEDSFDFLGGLIDGIRGKGWDRMSEAFDNYIENFRNFFKEWFGDLIQWVKDKLPSPQKLWEGTKETATDVVEGAGNALDAVGNWFGETFGFTPSAQPLANLETPKASAGNINMPSITNNNSSQNQNIVYQFQANMDTSNDALSMALS